MKKNNKGFTLAEMLIVVAIIGILIAILVPAFAAQLEKARKATDEANIRSAISEQVSIALMNGTASSGQSVTLKGTSYSGEVAGYTIPTVSGTITVSADASGNPMIGGTALAKASS